MTHWAEVLGVGPFFFLPRPALHDLRYRGEPTEARISVAISYAGATQIELIEPLDDEPTPYRRLLAAHGTGLHHVARFVDDYDTAIAEWPSDGLHPYFGGRALTEHQRFCYFDTERTGGRCASSSRWSSSGGSSTSSGPAPLAGTGPSRSGRSGGDRSWDGWCCATPSFSTANTRAVPDSTVVVEGDRIASVGDRVPEPVGPATGWSISAGRVSCPEWS